MAQLIMRRGPKPGKVYEITDQIVQIGRGARNDIIIEDHDVSREHCRLVRTESVYEIYDLDSSNGTFVNGQRVRDNWPLPVQSIIELGESITLEFTPAVDEVSAAGSSDPETASTIGENAQYFFVVTSSNDGNRAVYPLEGETIDVGRGTANQVIIVEAEMSRHHLRLKLTEQGYEVVDIGSTNGTTINGVDLTSKHLLSPGDVLRIGTSVTIQYTDQPDSRILNKITDLLPLKNDRTETARSLPKSAPGTTRMLDLPAGSTEIVKGVEADKLADQILLLYASEDWDAVVESIEKRLKAEGVGIWTGHHLTMGSEKWRMALEQARLECWMLMVVVSPQALAEDHVLKIWRHFHNREKPVIMVVHESVERLPIGAARAAHVQYNTALPEAGLQQMIHEIRQRQ